MEGSKISHTREGWGARYLLTGQWMGWMPTHSSPGCTVYGLWSVVVTTAGKIKSQSRSRRPPAVPGAYYLSKEVGNTPTNE